MVKLVSSYLFFILFSFNNVKESVYSSKHLDTRFLVFDTIIPNYYSKLQQAESILEAKIQKRIKSMLLDSLGKKIKWDEYQLNHFIDKRRIGYHFLIYQTNAVNEFLLYADLEGFETLKFVELQSMNGKFLDSICAINVKNEKNEFEKKRLLSLSVVNDSSLGNEDRFVVYHYVSHKIELVPAYNLAWIFGEPYGGANTFISFHVRFNKK